MNSLAPISRKTWADRENIRDFSAK